MQETILITGVSSGLGRGLAEEYLARGAAVYGCSRRAPEDLVQRGLVFASVDLADEARGAEAFHQLVRGVRRWDCVLLNAGKLGKIRDMRETPLPDLRETMEINVWANKWILDTLFAEAEGVGQVIGISSGASHSGSRGWNGYSISKAALNMLIKVYSGEQPDTHFTAFAPGLVDTAMQEYLTGLPADDRYRPLEKLKAAKGTPSMPDPRTSAQKLIEAFPYLRRLESGAFADIRDLEIPDGA